MGIHGYPWISMDIHWYPLICMSIHGYPRISNMMHMRGGGETYPSKPSRPPFEKGALIFVEVPKLETVIFSVICRLPPLPPTSKTQWIKNKKKIWILGVREWSRWIDLAISCRNVMVRGHQVGWRPVSGRKRFYGTHGNPWISRNEAWELKSMEIR